MCKRIDFTEVDKINNKIQAIFKMHNINPVYIGDEFWDHVEDVEELNNVDGLKLRTLAGLWEIEWEKLGQRTEI